MSKKKQLNYYLVNNFNHSIDGRHVLESLMTFFKSNEGVVIGPPLGFIKFSDLNLQKVGTSIPNAEQKIKEALRSTLSSYLEKKIGKVHNDEEMNSFLAIRGGIKGEGLKVQFFATIDEGFLLSFRNMLPKPSLKIYGKISIPNVNAGNFLNIGTSQKKKETDLESMTFECDINVEEYLRSPTKDVALTVRKGGITGNNLRLMTLQGACMKFFWNISIEWKGFIVGQNQAGNKAKGNAKAKPTAVAPVPKAPPPPKVKISVDSIVQNLYKNEATKDITLIAGDGTEVKCHRLILTAQSTKLEELFQSDDFGDSLVRFPMNENTKEGLQYFVQCLYGLEIPLNTFTCELASELFQTAYKYKLTAMGKIMSDLLCSKGDEWYSVDSLLQLYLFIEDSGLKCKKGVRNHLLSKMTRMSVDVRECERYKQLSPTDALDLAWKLFDLK